MNDICETCNNYERTRKHKIGGYITPKKVEGDIITTVMECGYLMKYNKLVVECDKYIQEDE